MRRILASFSLFLYALCFANVQAQRVAPGVPPQHYQQYQQVPSQQVPVQQVPVQQVPVQQVPVQQVPMQQVPMQQVPGQHVPVQGQHVQHGNQQAHGHAHHPGQQRVLDAGNLAQERDHIAEHLDVPMDTNKMSDQELQFHYFKMHDGDNNNKLDGCELIKSLIHWHEQENKQPDAANAGSKLFKDDELVALIDPILNTDDTNKDGFIDYPEFIQAQHKAAANTRT